MTCLELLKMEFPAEVRGIKIQGCPHHYDYTEAPDTYYDMYGCICCGITCDDCWNRKADSKTAKRLISLIAKITNGIDRVL